MGPFNGYRIDLDMMLVVGVLLMNFVQVKCYWMQYLPETEADYYEQQERQLKSLLYNRRKHLNILTGGRRPVVDNVKWLVSYDGRPFDVELILIIFTPAWIALLLGFCINFCRGCRAPNEEPNSRRPKVSIIKLQQSRLEQKLGLTSVIGVDWYTKRFVMRANDRYVDIDAIIKADRESKSALRRNPWRFVRQMTKWIGWYLKYKKTFVETAIIANTDENENQELTPHDANDELNRRLQNLWHP